MKLSIIVGIAKNNEIGKNNALLWDLPADLQHFKETTSGHPVIMGQKTFESLGVSPDGTAGRPLPNRQNIVVTLDKDFKRNNCEVVYSLDELDELIKRSENPDEEFFIIGGGMIYKLFIDKADKLYITHVEAEFPDADTYFPAIDMTKWQKIKEEKHDRDEKNKYPYSFAEYIRN